ncbi:MAG: hypothetical protein NT133_06880 [Alphaproteobacteria bacterium]|nr:hypothetical protein [Alphaproteobacteria bacterium]
MARLGMGKSVVMMARVRRIVTEEARHALAAAIAAETATEAALRDITDTIARERELASALDGDDLVVEAYIVWLAEAGQQLEAARARRDAAAAAAAQARSRLNLAKAAEQAVERHIANAAEAARQDELRREQITLDEAARQHRPCFEPNGTTIARSPLANPPD